MSMRKKKKKEVKYRLDFDKIKTVKDILVVFRSLNPVYTLPSVCPDHMREIYDKGFLKEIDDMS